VLFRSAQKQGKSAEQVAALEISLAKERRTALRLAYADEALTQEERAKSLEEYNKISSTITKLELNRDINANNKKKELSVKAAEDAKKLAEDKIKAAQDAAEAEEKEFQEWLAIQVEKDETAQSNRDFQKAREEKEAADKKAADDAIKAQEEKDAADKKAREDKAVEEEIARKKAVADLEQEIFNNSQQLAQALINIVGQNTKAGKALALASIAADTAKALSGALANSQAPTPDNVATGGLAGIAKYIALATTILTNSKRAYDIIKAPAPSTQLSGGGGGGAAAAAVPRFNAPSTRIPGGGDEFTQVRRIYVTERDITNVQDKVRVTEGLSQF
jgi:chemotaxis protein histidine kinase CheA